MESLFDRISRILATPMSRSAAIKLIVVGVAGTVLAPFGFGQQGRGQGPCPDPRRKSARTAITVATGHPRNCSPKLAITSSLTSAFSQASLDIVR